MIDNNWRDRDFKDPLRYEALIYKKAAYYHGKTGADFDDLCSQARLKLVQYLPNMDTSRTTTGYAAVLIESGMKEHLNMQFYEKKTPGTKPSFVHNLEGLDIAELVGCTDDEHGSVFASHIIDQIKDIIGFDIFMLRYGGKQHEEIAKKYGLTRQRIEQIVVRFRTRAMKRLMTLWIISGIEPPVSLDGYRKVMERESKRLVGVNRYDEKKRREKACRTLEAR